MGESDNCTFLGGGLKENRKSERMWEMSVQFHVDYIEKR